jgi:hypothetical protein
MIITGPPNALAVVGQPVELFVAEVRRQFGAHTALCGAVTA